jgi:hypothetical protein
MIDALRTPWAPQLAVEPGFEILDTFSLELLFLGVAMLLAIGALSRQHERPFSASVVYLMVGFVAAVLIHALDVPWIDPIADASILEHLRHPGPYRPGAGG